MSDKVASAVFSDLYSGISYNTTDSMSGNGWRSDRVDVVWFKMCHSRSNLCDYHVDLRLEQGGESSDLFSNKKKVENAKILYIKSKNLRETEKGRYLQK
jgi:hypothetical protein